MQHAGWRALASSAADPELWDAFSRLRDRGFIPPAPAILPKGTAASVERALAMRSSSELAELAGSIVAIPEAHDATATATLELFLAVRDTRSERLLERLEGAGKDVALQRLRFALAGARAALDPTAAARLIAALTTPLAKAEGLSRLVSHALSALAQSPGRHLPHGGDWLVPVDGGRHVANASLALLRRPALGAELGPVATWLRELSTLAATSQAPLHQAEAADAATRFDTASALYAVNLEEPDRTKVAEARAVLLAGPHRTAPLSPEPLLPKRGLSDRLARLADATPEPLFLAALLDHCGDTHGAAEAYFRAATSDILEGEALLVVAAEAVRLVNELSQEQRESLFAKLMANARLLDERELAKDALLWRRAELAFRLSPDPVAGARLRASAPPSVAPTPDEATPAPPSPNDPHHPENRLAAASDLIAEGRFEPAGNILAALVRKAEADTPLRLFLVVAGALEADEPPDDLVAAARKALEDDVRAPLLIAALRQLPTAAFALHEELLGSANDPSRPDPLRLAALEAWLNIWAATTTAPNPDLLQLLRESEPQLIAAAGVAIGGFSDPVAAITSFLTATSRFGLTAMAWSDLLLELLLGRLPPT